MRVCKYHGLGNTFIIMEDNGNDYASYAIKLCNQNIGIGADGLIVVKKDPLEMIFYNNDGSRAEMCGNGIRCFAKYCYDEKIVNSLKFEIITLAGVMIADVKKTKPFLVEINMGKPYFDNGKLGINKDINLLKYKIDNYELYSVFMGTVHTVMFVDNFNFDYEKVGSYLCNHPMFKYKTNVNMVKVLDKNNFQSITYERGAGLTKACGTGACASFVIGKELGYCGNHVNVHLQYGSLSIREEDSIFMQGPAVKIADIEWEDF